MCVISASEVNTFWVARKHEETLHDAATLIIDASLAGGKLESQEKETELWEGVGTQWIPNPANSSRQAA